MLLFVWLEVCCTVNELLGDPNEGGMRVLLCRGAGRKFGTIRASALRQTVVETPGMGKD